MIYEMEGSLGQADGTRYEQSKQNERGNGIEMEEG